MTVELKAVTLTQPWAALVACEAKMWETRSWAPPEAMVGQRVAIHAGKGLGPAGNLAGFDDVIAREPFASALAEGGYGRDRLLAERGFILATAVLAAFERTEEIAPRLQSDELAFGDYTPGRWAWQLIDVVRLGRPVGTRGALGLWNVQRYPAGAVAVRGGLPA